MTHPIIDSVSLGKVALFYQQNTLRFGYITHLEANKVHLQGINTAGYSLNPARLLLLSSELKIDSIAVLADFIAKVEAGSEAFQALCPAGDTFFQICQKYAVADDISRFALYLHLKNKPYLYRQKHDRFYRLDAAEADARQAMDMARQEREAWLQKVAEYIEAGAQGGARILSAADALLLKQELRLHLQGQKKEDLEKLLKAASGQLSLESLIIRLRRSLGDVALDPVLEASGLPISFDRAYHLPDADWESLPIAAQTAFSIDDEGSLDFDDAISLQKVETGYRLGIHISLVAGAIHGQSQLFAEALMRVSSLYLPPQNVPMLPEEYSQQRFSLKSKELRPVLSQYFALDESYQIEEQELKLERIGIGQNYSYTEVAKKTQETPFKELIQISKILREKRDNSEDKEAYYQILVQAGRVKLKRIDPQSPGRLLIEELMILYNSTLAAFGTKYRLPLIYRNISKFYDEHSQFANSTAYLSTQAAFHPGIGVSAYLHLSSPIRRVVDLINQMQILSHLQEDTLCFNEAELQGIIVGVEKRILQIRETMQKSERYWFLKYLEQNHLQSPLQAWHRGYVNGKVKAEIMPWGKTVLLLTEALPQAESFHLIIYQVDWEKGCLVGDLIG